MIRFEAVDKVFRSRGLEKVIVNNASLDLPDRNIAVLGANGAGKSTLLRMIAGTELPTRGRIQRAGRVSWPLGLATGFNGSMTGIENVTFLARIYGQDTERVIAFVEEFAELGPSLKVPWSTYSSGMRARLAFSVSMAIAFDIYLVVEITAVGDANFKAKCHAAFRERRRSSRVVMVSHSMKTLRDYCDVGLVLLGGKLSFWEDLEDAIAYHEYLMGIASDAEED